LEAKDNRRTVTLRYHVDDATSQIPQSQTHGNRRKNCERFPHFSDQDGKNQTGSGERVGDQREDRYNTMYSRRGIRVEMTSNQLKDKSKRNKHKNRVTKEKQGRGVVKGREQKGNPEDNKRKHEMNTSSNAR